MQPIIILSGKGNFPLFSLVLALAMEVKNGKKRYYIHTTLK